MSGLLSKAKTRLLFIEDSPLWNHHLLSGGAWALGGKVLIGLEIVVVNVLLARLLSPEEMGAYFLTFSLVSVASLLAQLGLNQTAVRLIAESLGTGKPGRARAALRIVFRYVTLGTLFVTGIFILGAGAWLAHRVFQSGLITAVIGLAAGWVAVFAFQNLLAETFRGFHDIRLATVFGGVVSGVLSVVLLALLWGIQGYARLDQVLILSILSGMISNLAAGFFLYRKVSGLEGEGELHDNEVLKIAFPLLLTNLTLFALTQADLWILGAFRPHEEVALYGAAARLVALIQMPLSVVNAVVPPLIAGMYAQGKKKELESALQATATVAGIPAFLITAGFVLFSGPLLGMVYGDYYRGGAVVLTWLSVGQLVNVLAGSCGYTLIMTGHQTTMMNITFFSGFLTVAGCLWWVKDYGAPGVAGVAALTLILQNLLMWFFARRKAGIWTHARFALPVGRNGK